MLASSQLLGLPQGGHLISKTVLVIISLGTCAFGLPFVNWGIRFAEHRELDMKGAILVGFGAFAISFGIMSRVARHRDGKGLLFRAILLGALGGSLIAGWALYVIQVRRGYPELVFTLFGGSVFGSILGIPIGASAASLTVPLLRWMAKEESDLAYDSIQRAWLIVGAWLLVVSAVAIGSSVLFMPNAVVFPICTGSVAILQLAFGAIQRWRLATWLRAVSRGQFEEWSIVEAESRDARLPYVFASQRGCSSNVLVWQERQGASDGLSARGPEERRVALVGRAGRLE